MINIISRMFFHGETAYCILATHGPPTSVKNFREAFVKVRGPSEHLYEDIQLSLQCRESFITDIDQCEIFIATFIATFDENRLKPNTHQGLSPFTISIDFQVCYENCESLVSNRTGFVKKSVKSDDFLKLNASGKNRK